MKKLSKTIAITLLLIGTMTLFTTSEVKAALQSNTNTQYTNTKIITTWVPLFRQMENSGNALGLNETFNSTTLVAEKSNNIDSHMMKSTEYGAIAILSASAYGNPSNDNAITTTTGNNTGMILNTVNWEWVAGGVNTGTAFKGKDARYVDSYPATYSTTAAKRGDGLGTTTDTNPGTCGWHKASGNSWVNSRDYAFARGGGGIFSLCGSGDFNHYARGVVVCGEGL